MFAIVTDASAHVGEVNQFTWSKPTARSAALTTPDSLLSSHAHVDADTISGSSHGTRNSARSVADSGNPRSKNTASARPSPYWNSRDTTVNTAVFTRVRRKAGLPNTAA